MWRFLQIIGLSLALGVFHSDFADGQQPVVTLEIYAEPGVQANAMHEWLSALKQHGMGRVRIQAATQLPSPAIERDKNGNAHVTATLSKRNQLQLPGLSVNLQQSFKIVDWAKQLSATPEQIGEAVPELAFGMTAEQLVGLRRRLSRPLGVSSMSKSAEELLPQIRDIVDLPIRVTESAGLALRSPDPIEDELEAVSVGTATAAILRPLGLAMIPMVRRNDIELQISEFKEAEEFWPVGWPADRPDRELAPQLFEFLPIDIEDVPMTEAISSLSNTTETAVSI